MKQVRYESESADTRDIRTLFQEYSQIKGAEVCFVSFGNELEHLEEIYSAPKGSRIVAYDNDYPVGCVALKKVDDTTEFFLKQNMQTKQTYYDFMGENFNRLYTSGNYWNRI